MNGIVDVGGGMRGVYTAGIYDYLLDRKIKFDYGAGVSAGSANLMTYFAQQKGRTLEFDKTYSFRKQYMSLSNLIHKGSYIDMDYVYGTLSNSDGEYPLDYKEICRSGCHFNVIATDAVTALPHYFSENDVQQDNYNIMKASCSIPVVCRPYRIGSSAYFDGGISDPVPYKKAFEQGCTRVVVLLTLPYGYRKPMQKHFPEIQRLLKEYPAVAQAIGRRHIKYNTSLEELAPYETGGKVLVVAPESCCGVDTLTKDKDAIQNLYNEGYRDGEKIERFLDSSQDCAVRAQEERVHSPVSL